jgi:hypothetical protein
VRFVSVGTIETNTARRVVRRYDVGAYFTRWRTHRLFAAPALGAAWRIGGDCSVASATKGEGTLLAIALSDTVGSGRSRSGLPHLADARAGARESSSQPISIIAGFLFTGSKKTSERTSTIESLRHFGGSLTRF